jgi:CheY-like chemotaxis protein
MPEMDGYQVLEQLKVDPRLRDIPVIMISAVDELESVVRCIELGVQPWDMVDNSISLCKPISGSFFIIVQSR